MHIPRQPPADASPSNEVQSFQPGQLGIRHLLGAMVVISLIAGLSASQLRSLPTLRAWEVAGHWALVWGIGGGIFYFQSLRRRRNRTEAGPTLLSVLCVPMSDGQRKLISWLLTAAVVADGVIMSAIVLPWRGLLDLWNISPTNLLWLIIGQGLLWGFCLTHWLTNVYWIEFCENGLLTHSKYYPWRTVTRIGWSPTKTGNLVVLHRGLFAEVTIDPAAHDAVSGMLEQVTK
jgi:hypothetical protein